MGDYAPSELAVFACDFGRLHPRPGLPALSDCPGAAALRPRSACGGADDLRDRLRLREALLAQRGVGGGGGSTVFPNTGLREEPPRAWFGGVCGRAPGESVRFVRGRPNRAEGGFLVDGLCWVFLA